MVALDCRHNTPWGQDLFIVSEHFHTRTHWTLFNKIKGVVNMVILIRSETLEAINSFEGS